VHTESWLGHSTTSTKKRVRHLVRACRFVLNGLPTLAHLNVLLLGSYSMLLGMDWLYLHMNKLDCYDKAIEFLNDNGEQRILQGRKKATSVRMVTVM